MISRRLRTQLLLVAAASVAVACALPYTCALQQAVISERQRTFVAKKSRSMAPAENDFDRNVTLRALMAPGNDRLRWVDSRAASVEGYVVAVRSGGIELANCFSMLRRDTHIEVAARPDAPARQRMTVEVTPVFRDRARAAGQDWTTRGLLNLVGQRVRFEGWLMFDIEHDEESENTSPGRPVNWRATAWELHPVTAIHVLTNAVDKGQ